MAFSPGRRALLAGLTISVALSGWARALDVPTPRPRPAAVQVATSAKVATPRGPSGASGWLVVDLDSGKVLDEHAADRPFAPASVAKLPTAVYALERLGYDHRFETRLEVRGTIAGDHIDGDLALVGGGDPELDTDALLPLVMALKETGAKRVKGRFLVERGPAPEIPAIDPTQPAHAAYNPAVSGLNLNFNRVRVEWPAKAEVADIKVTARAGRLNPDVRGVRVLTEAERTYPVFQHDLVGGAEVWSMAQRELSRAGGRWLPVRQPALYTGDVFAVLAWTQGVALNPPIEAAAGERGQVLASHFSRPLAQILDAMLFHSTNLTAELVGAAASGLPGDMAGSAAAMNDWAAGYARFASGDPGFQLANHSGLSTASRISPRRLVDFLRVAATRPAVPGIAPADERAPRGVAALLRPYNVAVKNVKLDYDKLTVLAKTGTMDYVRGLAGYIVTPKGKRLAFAVFSNNLKKREGAVERIDRAWMARARAFERELIRDWVMMVDG